MSPYNYNPPTPQDPVDFRNVDTWRMFRIMAEFVDGFEEMANIQPAVSIFGSARSKADSAHYKMAQILASKLSEVGYNIITGGGPGVMEGANHGASDVGKTDSIGLNIDLPFEQKPNPYINKLLSFRYFFVRKVMFTKYSCGIVVLPGGFGTLDEFFEIVTLVQTHKAGKRPIFLMDEKFYAPLIAWLRQTLLEEYNYICPEDMDLIQICDDPDIIVQKMLEICPPENYKQTKTNNDSGLI